MFSSRMALGRYPYVIPRGSKYPIFKESDPKSHVLNGFWDSRILKYWVLGPSGIYFGFLMCSQIYGGYFAVSRAYGKKDVLVSGVIRELVSVFVWFSKLGG